VNARIVAPGTGRAPLLRLVRAAILLALLAGAVPTAPAAGRDRLPAPWSGVVVGASDGDTLQVLRDGRAVKVRLWGVDTPEKSQDFGKAAKRFTLRATARKTVRVEPRAIDRYGRTVALVTVDGRLLNEALVNAGYAWVYRQYCEERARCSRWQTLEARARAARRGLWAQPDPEPPWDYRRGGAPDRRREATQAKGPLHGNERSLVFHRPGCRDYDCKRCTARFVTPAAAERAGYRPCGRCQP